MSVSSKIASHRRITAKASWQSTGHKKQRWRRCATLLLIRTRPTTDVVGYFLASLRDLLRHFNWAGTLALRFRRFARFSVSRSGI